MAATSPHCPPQGSDLGRVAQGGHDSHDAWGWCCSNGGGVLVGVVGSVCPPPLAPSPVCAQSGTEKGSSIGQAPHFLKFKQLAVSFVVSHTCGTSGLNMLPQSIPINLHCLGHVEMHQIAQEQVCRETLVEQLWGKFPHARNSYGKGLSAE